MNRREVLQNLQSRGGTGTHSHTNAQTGQLFVAPSETRIQLFFIVLSGGPKLSEQVGIVD